MMQVSAIVRRRPQASQNDLCTTFCNLYIAARGLSHSSVGRAAGGSNNATPNPMHSALPQTTRRDRRAKALMNKDTSTGSVPTKIDKLAAAQESAKASVAEMQKRGQDAQRTGGLDKNSIFADDMLPPSQSSSVQESFDEMSGEGKAAAPIDNGLSHRTTSNMQARLNPNPLARALWQRKMIIRHIQHRGRLPRAMVIARTERNHLSASRFFKTSVKKLMPLARQIAGKSLDEAILQMRFSKKQAAMEVKKHLIQARNEAIVIRGMGLHSSSIPGPDGSAAADYASSTTKPYLITDPSNIAPPPGLTIHSRPKEKRPTDIYVAEAWVNKGRSGKSPSARARGRVDLLSHPHTGITVLLKEEKTRTREQAEKEAKAIRKRLSGKKLWTALPDRPIPRQSQYLLW